MAGEGWRRSVFTALLNHPVLPDAVLMTAWGEEGAGVGAGGVFKLAGSQLFSAGSLVLLLYLSASVLWFSALSATPSFYIPKPVCSSWKHIVVQLTALFPCLAIGSGVAG
ncbi:hypothetical protein Pcinc_001583 [Petrolisthes cinctipes]|uniref:Uncharacterized protein n=1 Tax=Petrolisthes cinctipes TaxID=88211 RepID=A0AAE1L4E7_PETCI|nr:hypothetical protein Pcinc_001583 [Petrolisthes cinctipes]